MLTIWTCFLTLSSIFDVVNILWPYLLALARIVIGGLEGLLVLKCVGESSKNLCMG
jgi:hypothetical protein